MDQGVQIGVLGPIEVTRGGAAAPITSHKQCLLLVGLLVRPNPVSTDALVDVIWGEKPPASARSTLKTHVSNLRAALDPGTGTPVVVGHRNAYELVLDDEQVDAWRFEAIATRASSTARELRRALELWRGPALGDVRDESFAQAEAARLDELRLATVERCIDEELAQGRHAELVGELEVLTTSHPLRERLWGQRMRALYGAGRQAEALRACATLRATLREELGIDPSLEIQNLERRILNQDEEFSARQQARVSLSAQGIPTPVHEVIGREEELARLGALATHRLVVLTGAGGIGKTTLAFRAARRFEHRYADRSVVVDLAAAFDAQAVAAAFARAVSAPPTDDRTELVDHVSSWLAPRELLLVVDNCEHVLGAAADVVERILAAAPDVAVLATSREPLGIVGEIDHSVAPLPAPQETCDAADWKRWPALRLFAERACAARPSFNPDGSNVGAAARICTALDGLPLAIELAAARVAHLSPAQIAERLDDRFALLTAPGRRLERHQTLRGAVDWSYDLLDPDEQRLFARLAVFVGEFALEAVEGICAGDGNASRPIPVLDILGSLVRKSLVVAVDRGDVVRYRLLETLREYAGERLRQSGEWSTIRRRHCDWYLEWAESVPIDQAAWSTHVAMQFRREQANLRAALEAGVEDDRPEFVARLLAGTFSLWRQWGGSEIADCRRWLDFVFGREVEVDDTSVSACHMLAAFVARMTRVGEAVEEAVHATRAIERAPHPGWAACGYSTRAHCNGAFASQFGGRHVEDALRDVEAARALLPSLPRAWRIPVTWDLTLVYINLERFDDCRELATAVINDLDTLDPEYTVEELAVRAHLAIVLHLQGSLETASRAAAPAVEAIETDRLVGGWMTVQPRMGLALALAGAGAAEIERARRLAREALPRSATMTTSSNVSDFVITLAAIAGLEGDWERAATLFGAARRMGVGQPSPFRSPPGWAVYHHYNERTKTELGEETSRLAWKAGYEMTFEEAVALAVGV